MNILHITDSHGAPVAPEKRMDMYYITFLKKLTEIKYVIEKENIDLVLHTGDLFHRSRVSNKFMGQTAKVIKKWSAPLYVVPGNHDIDGYNISTIDQTSLGLLERTGVIKLLTRNAPIRFEKDNIEVAISGQEFYNDIDTGNMEDFEMLQDDADINILAIHGYIANTPQHPDIRCTQTKDIVTDADIVLSGHYHESFFEERDDVSFYNPGSMLRVEANSYNESHMPQYGILKINKDANGDVEYKYTFHKFLCAEPFDKVFDQAKIQTRSFNVTLDKFKDSITEVIQSISGISTANSSITEIEKYIDAFCNEKPDADKPLMMSRANYIYSEATQQIQDEDNVIVGFIPSQDVIKIKSLDIENFQVHSNTHIDFSYGLNIITGESNNGKSSILRAIDWVTDNYPLGTEFIQTGKKHCKVRITYSNNTFIERYRTQTQTGYYRVGVIHDDGTEEYEQYEGFTNNVPIEVINTHQMPKVSITKNIETHLNKIGQLEKPFLITDSVNEKAAAIGKITGTDVIDAGIKNIASEIAGTRKEIKQLEISIADGKRALDGIDINTIKDRLNYLVDLELKYKNSNNLLTKAEEIKNDYNSLRLDMENSELEASRCRQILLDKNNVILLRKYSNEYSNYISLLEDYEARSSEVSSIQEKIKRYNKVLDNKESIEKLSKSIKIVKELFKILADYNTATTDVKNYKKKIKQYKDIIKLKKVINREIINTVSIEIDILWDHDKFSGELFNHNNHVQELTDFIGETKEQIEDMKNEMKEFVIESKVCPCCGQQVTEEHVPSIIKMLKG